MLPARPSDRGCSPPWGVTPRADLPREEVQAALWARSPAEAHPAQSKVLLSPGTRLSPEPEKPVCRQISLKKKKACHGKSQSRTSFVGVAFTLPSVNLLSWERTAAGTALTHGPTRAAPARKPRGQPAQGQQQGSLPSPQPKPGLPHPAQGWQSPFGHGKTSVAMRISVQSCRRGIFPARIAVTNRLEG